MGIFIELIKRIFIELIFIELSAGENSSGLVVWVARGGGDDGELRPWHYTYVCRIESRLIMRVRYDRPDLPIRNTSDRPGRILALA